MAEFRSAWEPQQKMMSLALPMILANRRLKQQKAQADRNFLLRKMKLMQEVEETKDKIMIDQYLESMKAGSEEGVQATAPHLAGQGYNLPMTPGQPAGPASDPLPGKAVEPDFFVPEKSTEKEDPLSVLGKLLSDRDSLPEGDPRRDLYDKLINKKLSKVKSATKETPKRKELKRLEDDIMQIASKMESIESGQDIVSKAIGSERGKVATDLQKRLLKTLELYKKKGGNPERLGFDLKAIKQQIQQQKSSEIMKLLPSPKKHKNEIATDAETGNRYKSDGKKWVEIK